MSAYFKRTRVLAVAVLLAFAMTFGFVGTSQAYEGQLIEGDSNQLSSLMATNDDGGVAEIAYGGDALQFVKEDLASTFGMLTPKEGTLELTRSGGVVHVAFTPTNQTVYAGFYLKADVAGVPAAATYPVEGFPEGNWVGAKGEAESFTYAFDLPESYCGYAWPVAPIKTEAKGGGTTSAQYYLAIPAADKISQRVAKPIAKSGLIYSGEAQTGVAAGNGYTVKNGSSTNAGTYKAIAKLNSGYVWADGTDADLEISFTIAKATAKVPAAKVGLVYNGNVQTGVAAGAGYTVKNNSATNAGSYTATLTADANHQFAGAKAKVTIKWSIAKAANPLKLAKVTRNVKLAKVKKSKRVVAGAKVSIKGQGTVTYTKAKVNKSKFKKYFTVNKKTGKVTVKKGTPKGTYRVTVKAVAAGNANYNKSAAKTAVVTIKVK